MVYIFYYGLIIRMMLIKNEEHTDTEDDMEEEATEDTRFENERDRHWRMIFEDNGRRIYVEKVLLHTNRWDV